MGLPKFYDRTNGCQDQQRDLCTNSVAERKALLDNSLIVRKGQAAPSESKAIPKGTKDTIALTVRLDAARYDRLIAYSARTRPRMKNQEILVRALDMFLDAYEE